MPNAFIEYLGDDDAVLDRAIISGDSQESFAERTRIALQLAMLPRWSGQKVVAARVVEACGDEVCRLTIAEELELRNRERAAREGALGLDVRQGRSVASAGDLNRPDMGVGEAQIGACSIRD